MGERKGIFNNVITNLGTTERSEIGASTKLSTDVFGESADVGAGATVNADGEEGIVIVQNIYTVNFDFATRNLEISAFTC